MVFTYTGADYLDETEYPPLIAPPIDRLYEIAVPVLVLAGELDLPDFRLIADILAENIPGAESLVVPDAGHVLPLEQPEAVGDALLAFLTGVEASAPS
jgi:pimeloyl-ACP methyl ester carboxylesterase